MAGPLRRRAILAAAAGAAALAALAPHSALAEGGTLRARINADIRSSDPGTNRDANTDAVVLHTVEGLVAFREDTSVGPLLAESYDIGEDGKRYTFHLRQGVKFHNGATLTADDVVWSLKRYLDPATGWRCLPDFDGRGFVKILAVEAADPATVVITIDQPSALFLAMMARPDCGETAITHRASLGPDGKWQKPIGTGPFKFGEWRRGQYIELTRFDDYASREGPRDGYTGGKTVMVDKVRLTIIPDSAAAKAALLGNSLDVANVLSIADYQDLKDKPEVTAQVTQIMDLDAILFQTKDPLLKDVRIRRAIALALDTKEIANAVMQGLAKPNNSALPVSSPYYDAVQATGFKPDLEAAKKLLREAGYKGQPIKMIANKRYVEVYDSAVIAQAMAQQAGINIETEELDWATQLDRYSKGDYQAMSFSYSARLDPSLSYEMLMGPKSVQPRKVWDDPEAQAMLLQSMRTQGKEQRQALFDAMHKRFLDEVPMIVLFNPLEISATRKNVVGFKGWPYGEPRYWGVSLK
jgi:peptide/nickel transport system substrate-binding protein